MVGTADALTQSWLAVGNNPSIGMAQTRAYQALKDRLIKLSRSAGIRRELRLLRHGYGVTPTRI